MMEVAAIRNPTTSLATMNSSESMSRFRSATADRTLPKWSSAALVSSNFTRHRVGVRPPAALGLLITRFRGNELYTALLATPVLVGSHAGPEARPHKTPATPR